MQMEQYKEECFVDLGEDDKGKVVLMQ